MPSKLKRSISYLLMLAVPFVMWSCTKKSADPDPVDQLIGSYDVFEQCDKTLDWSYTIEIIKSTSSDGDVIIKNFGDYDREVPATVNDDMILYDYAEPEFTLRGNGEIKGSAITLYYVNADGDFILTCTANCTKQ